MSRSKSSKAKANKQQAKRKPQVPSKIALYVLPVKVPGVHKGLIVAPAKSWIVAAELVESIDGDKLLKYDVEDLYNKVLDSFYRISHAVDISTTVKSYAKKCHGFATNESFKKEFINVASVIKDMAEKAHVESGTQRLVRKGKMKAITIIDTSLDVVGEQVQNMLEGRNKCIIFILLNTIFIFFSDGYGSDESNSSQEKLPSDISINHHPHRTNDYVISYNNENEEEEQEEGQEEEQSSSNWVVDGIYDITKECYEFKSNTLRSQANPSTLSDIKILAMNDIYLFSNERNNSITKYFLNDMHKSIMAELKWNRNLPVESASNATTWCTGISNIRLLLKNPPTDWLSALTMASSLLTNATTAASKNVIDIHTAHTLVQTLPMLVARSPLSKVEDSYVQQILSPMLQSIFHSDERFEVQWANAELASSGLKTYKPDFTVFTRVINVECVLLVSEFKPTKSNSAVESDLVKLGRQMQSTYNDLVNDRLGNPTVCGIRSEGTRLTTYCMDMPSPNMYRMMKLAEISLYENIEQLILLPNIIMKLLQLKNFAAEVVSEVESSILYAAKTTHQRPARPPLSWLSHDSHTLSRKSKKST
ncbi:hypothetical protein MBANPS3_009311 [Mucor bainieri]